MAKEITYLSQMISISTGILSEDLFTSDGLAQEITEKRRLQFKIDNSECRCALSYADIVDLSKVSTYVIVENTQSKNNNGEDKG